MIELINELHENGKLHKLLRAGLISSTIFTYRNIFNHYKKELDKGIESTQAAHNTSNELKYSIRYVWKAIEKLK